MSDDSRREEAKRWTLLVCAECGQQAHSPGSRCSKDRRRTWTRMAEVEVMPVSEHEAELARLSLPDPEKDRLREVEKAAREVDAAVEADGFVSGRPLLNAAITLLRSALSESSPSSGESEGQA